MELGFTDFLFFIAFYLIGSIPFALIVYKCMSTTDPRKSGSMNPGATNMYRVAGGGGGGVLFRAF
jgi:glycerol-3-phosphate acyltransferase PlsY